MSMALSVAIQAIRRTHTLAGFTAFFVAPVPLLTAKGGATHRCWGKIYFWAMAVVAITAVVLGADGEDFRAFAALGRANRKPPFFAPVKEASMNPRLVTTVKRHEPHTISQDLGTAVPGEPRH